jgi:hypothetical protein
MVSKGIENNVLHSTPGTEVVWEGGEILPVNRLAGLRSDVPIVVTCLTTNG